MQVFVRGILTLVATFAAIPVVAGNVGFLDTERAITSVKEGQRQLRLLDEWATQKSNEVEAMRKRVNDLAEQINSQRTIASDEVIRGLEDEFMQAKRAFEDAGRVLQRDFEAKQSELLAEVATRVRDLASEYAVANGFDAILMFETTPLVYVTESAVITDALIRIYNERYPVN